MTLCDTGPLVALLNPLDDRHAICVHTAALLPRSPLITTLPCYTEALHLLGRNDGLAAQRRLLQLRQRGALLLHVSDPVEVARMEELMERYGDSPMDFADASLVVAAEKLGLQRIFTLDRHFYAYRINGLHSFEVIP